MVTEQKKVQILFQANEVIRMFDPEMPIQMVQTLLVVMMRPGLTMSELGEQTGLTQSSVSRNVAALSKVHRTRRPGHDLVYTEEDPIERRRKLVLLSPKGKRLLEQVNRAMSADW